MLMDDRDFITNTLSGDRPAFEELVGRHRDAVYAVAYHYLGSADDAQDATQEAFVQAYLHLDQLRDTGKLRPWLRRIATNAAMGILRRREHGEESLDSLCPEAVPSGGDPHREAVRIVVRDALSKLSDKMRLTVTLSYIDGYSHAEIAEFLEVPVNTVRSRLQHAKRLLREDMIAMVTNVMHEDKPDSDFNRKVVDEALSRAREAVQGHATGDALSFFDRALGTLEKMQADEEQLRLKMTVLWERGDAAWTVSMDDSVKYRLQSLEIAEELGDLRAIAEKLAMVGVHYANMGQKERSIECYRKASDAYRSLGEPYGQGSSLMWLASQHMADGEASEARPLLDQALALFEQAGNSDYRVACLAALDLLRRVGDDLFPTLTQYGASCDIVERRDGGVWFAGQPGWSRAIGGGEVPALEIGSVFWQIAGLRRIVDASVPVGDGWSGDAFSYSFQPLKVVTTIRSHDDRVTTPAGTFENCLLLEQVTTESGLPDDAPERTRDLNRKVFCGSRLAWFAPGVGLAQLRVHTADGNEALIQLQEFHVEQPTDEYLPLALGNTWSYGWAGIPEEFAARETYRVAANEGERSFLEHFSYSYKRTDSS